MKVGQSTAVYSIPSENSTTALLNAIYNNDLEATQVLLKEGARFPKTANENTIHAYRTSILKMANQLDAAPSSFFIKRVLKQGFDVNTPVDQGYIALREAFVWCSHRPCILKELLKATDSEALKIKHYAMDTHLLHTFCAHAKNTQSTREFLKQLLEKMPKDISIKEWKDSKGSLPISYAADELIRQRVYKFLENYYSNEDEKGEMEQALLLSFNDSEEESSEEEMPTHLFPPAKRSRYASEVDQPFRGLEVSRLLA